MKIRLFLILGLIITFFPMIVNASNDVEYNLKITNDYKFIEEINYEISDYKQYKNGSNPFADIIENDKEVYIIGNSKYKKIKKFKNNKYYIKLSYVHNEYSMSNLAFLNNCFEEHNYTYDIDEISFDGNGGFYCFYGDSLKINIVTDFTVVSDTATKNKNKYTWIPTNENFQMNLKILKKNENSTETYPEYDENYDENGQEITDEDSNGNSDTNTEDNTSEELEVLQVLEDPDAFFAITPSES